MKIIKKNFFFKKKRRKGWPEPLPWLAKGWSNHPHSPWGWSSHPKNKIFFFFFLPFGVAGPPQRQWVWFGHPQMAKGGWLKPPLGLMGVAEKNTKISYDCRPFLRRCEIFQLFFYTPRNITLLVENKTPKMLHYWCSTMCRNMHAANLSVF